MTSATRSRAGFTLIELLVVIAIIAILAAILFPVFAKVREKARQTTCASNERQIGLALTQYVEDYDELYPLEYTGLWNSGSGDTAGWQWWQYQIYPYVKSAGIFTCPSNPNTQMATSEAGTTPLISQDYDGNTYLGVYANLSGNAKSQNGCDNGDTGTGDGIFDEEPSWAVPGPGVNLASIVAPSNTIAVFETTGSSWTQPNCSYNQPADPIFANHTRNTNYLFADGHVKALQPEATDTTTGGNLWSASQAGYDPTLAAWLAVSAAKYQ